jgi:hypothetical protein
VSWVRIPIWTHHGFGLKKINQIEFFFPTEQSARRTGPNWIQNIKSNIIIFSPSCLGTHYLISLKLTHFFSQSQFHEITEEALRVYSMMCIKVWMEMDLDFSSRVVFGIYFGANGNGLNFSNIYLKSIILLDKKLIHPDLVFFFPIILEMHLLIAWKSKLNSLENRVWIQ